MNAKKNPTFLKVNFLPGYVDALADLRLFAASRPAQEDLVKRANKLLAENVLIEPVKSA
jgi:hypothetical protein